MSVLATGMSTAACGVAADMDTASESALDEPRNEQDPAVSDAWYSEPDRQDLDEDEHAIDEGFFDSRRAVEWAKTSTNADLGTARQALASDTPCMSSAMIDRLVDGGRERKARGPFISGSAMDDCHTQGAAYRLSDKRIVVTCQGDDGKAHVAAYRSGTSPSTDDDAFELFSDKNGRRLVHPSSTQLAENFFPVAFADNNGDYRNVSGSRLRMYELSGSGEINQVGTGIMVDDYDNGTFHPHIGTLGMIDTGSYKRVIGCDWNCTNVFYWRWSDTDETFSFRGYASRNTVNKTTWSDAKGWASYNSWNVMPACSGGGYYLLGSNLHDRWPSDNRTKFHVYWFASWPSATEDLELYQVAWREFTANYDYGKEAVAVIPDPPRLHLLTFGENYNGSANLNGYELWFFDGASERTPPNF